MKKHLIIFSVAVFAFAATLIALGIYITRFDLSQLSANKLVEKAGLVGLILIIVLYIPLLLLRLSSFALIGLGVIYLFAGGTVLAVTVFKEDVRRLYKSSRAFVLSNAMFLSVIILADLIMVPYIFKHIHEASAALIVFTVLINATSVAVQITGALASKKLKLIIKGPSV